jgi:hypothetical protein
MTTLLGFNRVRTVTVIPETVNGFAEAFAFDVVTDMQQTHPGQAFRHPLQNGEEGITDATRLEPDEFNVSGITTDTPIRVFSPRHNGAVSLYKQLIAIREMSVPCTVITSWAGTLTSRWPEVITAQHGYAQGASIAITVNFVKFNLVYTQLAPAQVDTDVLLAGSQQIVAHPF